MGNFFLVLMHLLIRGHQYKLDIMAVGIALFCSTTLPQHTKTRGNIVTSQTQIMHFSYKLLQTSYYLFFNIVIILSTSCTESFKFFASLMQFSLVFCEHCSVIFQLALAFDIILQSLLLPVLFSFVQFQL